MMRARLAIGVALVLAVLGCEDDPRDLDYLRDAGGAGSDAAAGADAGPMGQAAPDAGGGGTGGQPPVDDGGADDGGAEDAGS